MQAVILCGGKGLRSYPFTEYFPKPLMPLLGRPILVHIMRLYAQQGVKDFILAAGHKREALEDYFDGRFPEWNIDIVDTGDESDTGERIRRCRDRLHGRFHATYGDGLGDVHLGDLVARHEAHGGLGTVTTVPLRSQYGTVVTDEAGRVVSFREKPVIADQWINAGFFVFEPQVFDHWTGTNLEQHVLPSLAARGALHAYRHRGFWKSMDTTKDQQELEALMRSGEARVHVGEPSLVGSE